MFKMNKICFICRKEDKREYYYKLLSRISTVIVKVYNDDSAFLHSLQDEASNLPHLLLIEKDSTVNTGNEVLKIVRDMGFSFPVCIISNDELFIQALIGISYGVHAIREPKVKDLPSESDFLFRVEMLVIQEQYKRIISAQDIKLDEKLHELAVRFEAVQDQIHKIQSYIETTNKVDVLQKVNDFMEQCKKKPLLMLVVSLIITFITVAGFKGIK